MPISNIVIVITHREIHSFVTVLDIETTVGNTPLPNNCVDFFLLKLINQSYHTSPRTTTRMYPLNFRQALDLRRDYQFLVRNIYRIPITCCWCGTRINSKIIVQNNTLNFRCTTKSHYLIIISLTWVEIVDSIVSLIKNAAFSSSYQKPHQRGSSLNMGGLVNALWPVYGIIIM